MEPMKHQYDFDSATAIGFLKEYGLDKDFKLNIEVNHATLAQHTMQHELAVAAKANMLGSIDANRGDYQNGWDTDQFPNNVPEMALAYYEILKAGGFVTGGTNFDAKLRRQSMDPMDLVIAHVGGMDTCARALKAAASMLEDEALSTPLAQRYAAWDSDIGQACLAPTTGLDDLRQKVLHANISPQPVSGKQELLEAVVNRYV